MNQLPKFAGIEEHFMTNFNLYKTIYDAPNPHEISLPGEWDTKLD